MTISSIYITHCDYSQPILDLFPTPITCHLPYSSFPHAHYLCLCSAPWPLSLTRDVCKHYVSVLLMTTEFNQCGVHEKECTSTHWSLVGSPVITQLKPITAISQESISANVCQREERTYEALWLVNLWQFSYLFVCTFQF